MSDTYFTAYNDTNIENLTIRGYQNFNNNSPTSSSSTRGTFYGNWQNVRIGRGISRVGSSY